MSIADALPAHPHVPEPLPGAGPAAGKKIPGIVWVIGAGLGIGLLVRYISGSKPAAAPGNAPTVYATAPQSTPDTSALGTALAAVSSIYGTAEQSGQQQSSDMYQRLMQTFDAYGGFLSSEQQGIQSTVQMQENTLGQLWANVRQMQIPNTPPVAASPPPSPPAPPAPPPVSTVPNESAIQSWASGLGIPAQIGDELVQETGHLPGSLPELDSWMNAHTAWIHTFWPQFTRAG